MTIGAAFESTELTSVTISDVLRFMGFGGLEKCCGARIGRNSGEPCKRDGNSVLAQSNVGAMGVLEAISRAVDVVASQQRIIRLQTRVEKKSASRIR